MLEEAKTRHVALTIGEAGVRGPPPSKTDTR